MPSEIKKDPIEGFHVTNYDDATQTLTISVDGKLFDHKASNLAMQSKAIEIICTGPGVAKVIFMPRED